MIYVLVDFLYVKMNSFSRTSNDNDENILSVDTMMVLVKCNKENTELHDICVNKNKFKIGRALDCDEHILTPLISRNHCIFIHNNDQWTVTDLSSTHTILNGKKLERGVPAHIEVGDVIQLSEHDNYKYSIAMYIKDEPEKKKLRLSQNLLDEEISKQRLFAEEQEMKRRELEVELIQKQIEQEELKTRLDDILKSKAVAEGKTEQLNEMINSLKEKIKCGSKVELQMQRNYNNLLSTVEIQQKEFEERLNEERKKWQQTLEMSNREKVALKTNMAEEMTMWREKQQTEWNSVINKLVQREMEVQIKLRNEKELLEQRLKEASDALREKTALAEELKNSAQNRPAILVEVAANQEVMETIDLTKEESASSSKSLDPTVDKVGNIMDEQLTCQICSELFVTAVTLNCSHTYCQYCIYLWMNKKHKCPICRGVILSVTRSLVLDSFIEQMVNDLSTQHKERRKDLCEERKVATQKLGVPSILRKRPPRIAKNSRY